MLKLGMDEKGFCPRRVPMSFHPARAGIGGTGQLEKPLIGMGQFFMFPSKAVFRESVLACFPVERLFYGRIKLSCKRL